MANGPRRAGTINFHYFLYSLLPPSSLKSTSSFLVFLLGSFFFCYCFFSLLSSVFSLSFSSFLCLLSLSFSFSLSVLPSQPLALSLNHLLCVSLSFAAFISPFPRIILFKVFKPRQFNHHFPPFLTSSPASISHKLFSLAFVRRFLSTPLHPSPFASFFLPPSPS